MTNKILHKMAVAAAVFVIIVVGISAFGLMVLGLSAVQAMVAQIGLPVWPLFAFVALAAIACAVGGE